MKRTITHMGRALTTETYKELTPQECEAIRADFATKPDRSVVLAELKAIHSGATGMPKALNYYVDEVRYKTKAKGAHWSITELIQSDELLSYNAGIIAKHPKIHPASASLKFNMLTTFRIGSGGAALVSNFPIATIRHMLSKYCDNGNYYDYSCGWGARLLGAMSSGTNYFGTDPNHELTPKLKVMADDYSALNKTTTKVEILTQGSEVFNEDWVDTMGLAFTSPPYFGLEDYGIGEQSYDKDTSYKDWLGGYFRGTAVNIDKYLVRGGYFAINIKDYGSYDLVKDTGDIIESLGYTLVGLHPLNPTVRPPQANGSIIDNREVIRVYQRIADITVVPDVVEETDLGIPTTMLDL